MSFVESKFLYVYGKDLYDLSGDCFGVFFICIIDKLFI